LITWSPLSSPELRRRGIRVLLATVAKSTMPADERLTFRGGQLEVLQRPYNQVSGVAHTHLHAVVTGRITPGKGQHLAARLARECGFDLVLAGPVGPYRQPAPHSGGSGSGTRWWRPRGSPYSRCNGKSQEERRSSGHSRSALRRSACPAAACRNSSSTGAPGGWRSHRTISRRWSRWPGGLTRASAVSSPQLVSGFVPED
jgi:hypothetical protein